MVQVHPGPPHIGLSFRQYVALEAGDLHIDNDPRADRRGVRVASAPRGHGGVTDAGGWGVRLVGVETCP
jgi:hypothetical protein